MSGKILVWGSGSQAKIYAHDLWANGFECTFVDPYRRTRLEWMANSHFIGENDDFYSNIDSKHHFIVAIGGEHGRARHDVMLALLNIGLHPYSMQDCSANIRPSTDIGEMAAILQSATVNHETKIGSAAILNTSCSIDHECNIGNGVHVMGAAAIAGRVSVGDWAVIGTNATVLPDITIGQGAFVGAGAVVTKNIAPGEIVAGVPARRIGSRTPARETSCLQWLDAR